jgi:hypothetical protein
MIRAAEKIKYSPDFEIVDQIPAFNQGAKRLFPAITIPAEKKTTFSCPDTHVEVLKGILPRVTKLLILDGAGPKGTFWIWLARFSIKAK